MRTRPGRVFLADVWAEECADLLLALNSGLPGKTSFHANSACAGLVKLCTLPLLAGENTGSSGVFTGHRRTQAKVALLASTP